MQLTSHFTCMLPDDRFVLKEMTKPEWQQFLEFAPHYFNYVINCHQNKLPTLLGKYLYYFSCEITSFSTVSTKLILIHSAHSGRIQRRRSWQRCVSYGELVVRTTETRADIRLEGGLQTPPHARHTTYRCAHG